jgi:hypothetical protein
VQVVGDLAYVADVFSGLLILDVSDPAGVTRRGGYDTLSHASDVQVVGNLAYIAGSYSGFHILTCPISPA